MANRYSIVHDAFSSRTLCFESCPLPLSFVPFLNGASFRIYHAPSRYPFQLSAPKHYTTHSYH